MKLGDDSIGLRTLTNRVDDAGNPVRDEFGAQIVDVVDVEVPWCAVTPTARRADTAEARDRSAPSITGYTVLAPPGTAVTEGSVIIWPITSRTGSVDTGDLQLSGRLWQVDGEPGLWDECVEMYLRAST